MNTDTLENSAAALASGAVTSRDLVEACLDRIGDPHGQGALAFTRVYTQQARDAAEAADILRRAGRPPSRYAGIPISIKDLFDVAGETTTAGSVLLAGAPPAARNATVVDRLLQAGLVLVGRTNMTEFAFSGVGIHPHYGTPRAPWRREGEGARLDERRPDPGQPDQGRAGRGHIPGGSSSGAAISITDGFALGAIGTDTGGSCRIPAALCGIAGFKPTQRRVSLTGALPLSPTLDSIGPLAATAADCAALDAILADEPERTLPKTSLSGLRLLLPTNLAFEHLDERTEDALDRAVSQLDRAGVRIERRPLRAFDAINLAHAKGAAPASPPMRTGTIRASPAVS
jgi:aspartyl-tRNA(Asn)/glutamyl-tRNA(Gln) amidotransferase subunit A